MLRLSRTLNGIERRLKTIRRRMRGKKGAEREELRQQAERLQMRLVSPWWRVQAG